MLILNWNGRGKLWIKSANGRVQQQEDGQLLPGAATKENGNCRTSTTSKKRAERTARRVYFDPGTQNSLLTATANYQSVLNTTTLLLATRTASKENS